MRVKFWGVRGSVPTPERRNSGYGGNTPCIEVRLANGTIIILDCGTGLRGLGKSLAREYGEKPIVAYIFLSHFHWDHIQGIPFFVPLYEKGNSCFFHSVSVEKQHLLQRIVERQMVYPYFPVDMSVMQATRNFYSIGPKPVNIHGAAIRTISLNHPQGCVAYRVDADGGSLVYATDTEPGSKVHDRNLRKLTRGADVLIYDGQYRPEELLKDKKGWGHSSWLEGVKIAQGAGVRKFVLFHYEPDDDDSAVDRLVADARKHFPHTCGAREGMVLQIPNGVSHEHAA